MGNQIRHRMFAIIDRTVSSAQLAQNLLGRGVSSDGAWQLLSGDVVSSPADRQSLARILKAHPAGRASDGNTIYVSTAGGGVWKVSPAGSLQFFAGMPVTSTQDRESLAQIFAASLG